MRGFAIGAVLCLIAVPGRAQNVISARPGLINYTEGEVQIDGQPVGPKSNGARLLERDQVLDTQSGKAEVLLTPGVFLRVGDHSAIRMVSPELTDTAVELQRGRALVEVTELFKGNQIRILDRGSSTTVLKKGLYHFDADQQAVSVYDGKVKVLDDDREEEIGKGKKALLAGSLTTEKFDRKDAKDSDQLYRWSEVRSGFLSEANVASVRTVADNRGLWAGPGWYWNPFFSAYSFIPRDGILYSPFGFSFYSPAMVSYAPVYYYRPYAGVRIPGRSLPPPRVVRPATPSQGVTTGAAPRMSGPPAARGIGRGTAAPAQTGRGMGASPAHTGRTSGTSRR